VLSYRIVEILGFNPPQVFELSEIRSRLTEDDDLIRAQDIPEGMQLAMFSMSKNSTLLLNKPFTERHLDDAAMSITMRLSSQKTREVFSPNGPQAPRQSLVLAVTFALRSLSIDEFEVPYIWTHK
jgi:transcription elongation factor SPT6